jgi:hypothetical protein
MRIAYLVLADKCAGSCINLIEKIMEEDKEGGIFLHYDLTGSKSGFEKLHQRYLGEERVEILENRVACEWGTFSLVEATLSLIYRAKTGDFDYYLLLSESCYPLVDLLQFKSFLKERRRSWIETFSSDWIYDGIREDRYLYHHPIPFRKNRRVSRFIYKLQKFSGLKRKLPKAIPEVKFGSQWWCLKKSTMEKIIEYIEKNDEVLRFFRTVWIPDECFFQTIAYWVDTEALSSESLTYYSFDERGRPEVYTLDELSHIPVTKNNKFFIRKVKCIR